MKKMLQGRILDYTSIVFMTVVFVSLYYFKMSSHLYGFLLFLSFFPYFFKLFLNQKEETTIFGKEKKMPLIAFLLINFIVFIFFVGSIIYGYDFLINKLGWLLILLFFYLISKEYDNSFMIYFNIVFFFSIAIFWNKEHSFLEIISYLVYMYMIISNFKIKTSDKY